MDAMPRRAMLALLGFTAIEATMLLARGLANEDSYPLLDLPEPEKKAAAGGLRTSDGLPLAYGDDLIGWLCVENTAIDYPVMRYRETGGAPYYLSHNAFGKPDAMGTPYLDRRCREHGAHLMVYGHHSIWSPSSMFTDIHDAYRDEVLQGLGDATWTDLSGGDGTKRTLMCLCALSLESDDREIQTFEFSGIEGFRAWLAACCERADACVDGYLDTCEQATRCLSLVTCQGALPGTRGRTVVLFCA